MTDHRLVKVAETDGTATAECSCGETIEAPKGDVLEVFIAQVAEEGEQ